MLPCSSECVVLDGGGLKPAIWVLLPFFIINGTDAPVKAGAQAICMRRARARQLRHSSAAQAPGEGGSGLHAAAAAGNAADVAECLARGADRAAFDEARRQCHRTNTACRSSLTQRCMFSKRTGWEGSHPHRSGQGACSLPPPPARAPRLRRRVGSRAFRARAAPRAAQPRLSGQGSALSSLPQLPRRCAILPTLN